MSILKHKNSKIIDLTKPVEIKTYLIQAFCKTKYNENSKEYKNMLTKAVEKYENYEYKILKYKIG